MIPFVQFFNSLMYEWLRESVLPWMEDELERYESPPGFLEKMVDLVGGWCRRYEKKNFEH
jgi:hypothetical protein